jgi:phosphoribosylamine--glycine ligase
MKILVIGSGGREHALVWKIAQSKKVKKIYCAPGNAGIAESAECVPLKADDILGLLDFAKKEEIDLTVVGPEVSLVAGIVDDFEKEGLKIFGPSREAAQLEASKMFAKLMMKKCGVPTADFVVCRSVHEVLSATKKFGLPVVLKADGLAAGKGVVICQTSGEVEETADRMLIEKVFGPAGHTVVVEECLEGEEASLLALTNGDEAVLLASSQDHKRVFDKDLGANTGGMGAYSPAPVVTEEILKFVMDKVILPIIKGLKKEGTPYRGILYAGIMITKSGPKVLEFNVRFGDPETQAVLVRLESDLVEALLWTLGKEKAPTLKWDSRPSVCVVVASGGYPGSYRKGKVIQGLDKAAKIKDAVVFHAGTKKSGEKALEYLTDGGRVLGVTALGENLKKAIDTAYKTVKTIKFDEMHFRCDIGWRALKN